MKILILSTLKRRVGPDIFASRSRIIFQLASKLAAKGHKISLLGTEDSQVPGVEIIPVLEKGWTDLPPAENNFLRDIATLIKLNNKILEIQDNFDIIHNHTYPDYFPSIIEKELKIPLVTTLHALYDDYMDELLSSLNRTHFVALSKAYKNLYKKAKIDNVIYNGVDTSLYSFNNKPQDYLLWVGRLPKGKNAKGEFLDPKGVRWAIKLAKKTGAKLYLLGPCEDIDFFNKDVKPNLSDKIQWVGDVSPEQSVPIEKVVDFIRNAKVFLMTINQDEPFGLVMAEAGSCGTPVIAFKRGSVPEIVVDGLTGFVIEPREGLNGLKKALLKIDIIERENCRKRVEENFTIKKMVENYEELYKQLL